MKFDLEQAIKQSTEEDGKLDVEKLQGMIDNDYVNPIVAKQKPKFDEKAEKEFIESLGIENVQTKEQLVTHVNQTVDEAKSNYNELKSKYDELNSKHEEVSTNYNKLNGEVAEYKRKDMLLQDNYNGDVDYALYKLNREVSEDKPFEDVYKEFKETNPKAFAPNQVPTTGTQVGRKTAENKLGWEAKLEEKHPKLKEE